MFPLDNPQHSLESLPQWAQDLIKHLANQVQQLTGQVQQLTGQVQQLTGQVQQLTSRVHELEAQLAKNSSNSGKPPSSDGLKKPPKTQSLRGKSGKKPGGQLGRDGKTLNPVENPDKIEIYAPLTCKGCQGSLKAVEAISIDRRQVFDLPPISVIVTEHRAETRICPCCGVKNKGEFPEGVNAFVQYGERVKAFAAYFLHQHLIPFERVAQIFEDVFDIPLSPGTCANMDKKLFKNLEVFEKGLKAHLLACKVLHLDETGVRCEKRLHWIHVTSSETATFFGLHAKRGCAAIDEIGILPKYKGSVIHDHWQCYFSYQQVKHGLCNVHHLRELKYVHEEEKSVWAKRMADLLLKARKIVVQAREEGKISVAPDNIALIEAEYRCLLLEAGSAYLDAGEKEHILEGLGRQGFNLFRRFLKKMDEVLYFLRDLAIPFSNNLAEQDLRMEKVKQKISGCFRTFSGGLISCRVRSYISTARKQGWNILDSLAEAIRGSPRMVNS
jgi:transposase